MVFLNLFYSKELLQSEKWLQSIQELGHAVQVSNILSLQETIGEFFMMGLRLENGINLDNIKSLVCENNSMIQTIKLSLSFTLRQYIFEF